MYIIMMLMIKRKTPKHEGGRAELTTLPMAAALKERKKNDNI